MQFTAFLHGRWPAVVSILLVGLVVLLAVASAMLPYLPGAGGHTVSELRNISAAVIFAGSYLALAVGRIPGLSIDRAGIAMVGAGLMLASGALSLDEAYKAVDMDTIILLLGMMIVVANLRISGFFSAVTAQLGANARHPMLLLAALIAVSGVLSAFLVNDAICLVLTPLVLDVTLALKRQPIPYLLAVAMASNVGSSATITGNPQNILVGSFSQIPYADFALALGPVAIAGLVVLTAFILLLHRSEFSAPVSKTVAPRKTKVNRVLIARAALATLVLIALFFAGVVPAKAAIIIAGLLLLTRRIKSRRIYAQVDWSLLLMFVGLFIIVAGAQRALVGPEVIAAMGRLHLDQIPVLSTVTAALSNLVSNVPAVLMLKPFVETLPNHDTAWLAVAMSATLAGNFTLLASVANLIVVEKAAGSGIAISFWDHFRVGAPLTLVTLTIGTLWLWL